MPKRKSNDSHLPENKRAKLHRPIMRNIQTPTSEVRAPYTPVLSLANPKLFGKRKRVLDSQSDASEEPDTKRARRSSSPESPNMSLESWPSIGYSPCQEEPNPLEQFYIESHHEAWRIHEEYDSDTPADHQNPLPSPEPSDRDATDEDMAESDEWRFPSVGSTLNTPRLLSRNASEEVTQDHLEKSSGSLSRKTKMNTNKTTKIMIFNTQLKQSYIQNHRLGGTPIASCGSWATMVQHKYCK